WIQSPLEKALNAYYLENAVISLKAEFADQVPYEMLTIIEEEGMAPAKMKVNPESLLETLREANPDEAGRLAYTPNLVTAADLDRRSLADFAAEWADAGRSGDSTAAGRLWQMLSAEQQRQVEAVAEADDIGAAEAKAMALILNDLARRPAMHQAPELRQVRGIDDYMQIALTDLREQSNAGQLDGDDSRRWNRLLLTAVFPEYVKKPRVALVDLPFWRPIDVNVVALGAQEAFMIWLKAAFIAGIVISSPWVFWKLWDFVAAGLYPHEKHYVYLYLPFSLGLFFAGAALAFFLVFEPVLNFLFSFNRAMDIDPDPRISEWLSFVLFLPVGFGISFQLPLVMLFVQRIGLVTVEMYVSKWRIAILAIFVIAMVLTPADPISMMLMACPLTVLYFGGVGLCLWMPKSRNPYRELQAYEP
ncbi:MAG: twin-arginine translocase subunit TatC, partial [Planctomycetes bacterium]|nr:twin-arginine translocase subunit TatC [Planctomycetota bacterium]